MAALTKEGSISRCDEGTEGKVISALTKVKCGPLPIVSHEYPLALMKCTGNREDLSDETVCEGTTESDVKEAPLFPIQN